MKKELLLSFMLLMLLFGFNDIYAQCENQNPTFEGGINASGEPNWYYSFGNTFGVSTNTPDGSATSGHAPMGGAIAINNYIASFVVNAGDEYQLCADMAVSTVNHTWAQIKIDFLNSSNVEVGNCSAGVTADGNWANYCTSCIAPPGTAVVNVYAQSSGAEFWVDNLCVTNLTALPIELSSIDAYAKKGVNVIEWITSSEDNVNYFEIQKSIDGISNWETVSRTNAAGFSDSKNTYQIVDASPSNLTYYRLLNHDFDGKMDYSKILSVKRQKLDQIAIFPSPAYNNLNVRLNLEKESEFTIHNITGKIIFSGRLSSDESNHQVDIGNLVPGIYLFKVNNNVVRFVKA